MAKKKALKRLPQRGLLILLVVLAAAAVYSWLSERPSIDKQQIFARIYHASALRASNDRRVFLLLGAPVRSSAKVAQYRFYRQGGHRRIEFKFPIMGPRGAALVKGKAVLLGKNWLVVQLVAVFPGRSLRVNLTPGVFT